MRLPSLLLAAALSLSPLASRAAAPVELRFTDFFAQPIGPRGLEPSAKLLSVNGQAVKLTGFMVRREQPQAGSFLLVPVPITMAEHADGEADDLPPSAVTVVLASGQRDRLVAFQPGPLTLSGRLEFGAAEDATGRVSWVRLHLDPAALATQAGTAAPAHTHGHSH
ncbi:hypothetical protein ACG02S_17290 [Roseateles sp. DC23W]|uniref:Copper(I)-binding protein n=1 Tax=Pelomonas dachongensis TaxID=3299029 RepID=A0ABW7EQ75_9BURK